MLNLRLNLEIILKIDLIFKNKKVAGIFRYVHFFSQVFIPIKV